MRSTKPIDDLKSLHMQLKQQGRKEATFDITKPTNGTLDWTGVQLARCLAEKALTALGEEANMAQRQ